MEEWELSKENVLPQKKGRDVQVLNSCLEGNAAQVEEQKRRLMLEIESYSGDDPLQPWIKVIKWAKQAYPAGGSQSPILPLLESCARKFRSDARYKSDKRYLTVWIQYADCCSDPSDIFAFLEANEIGHEHALYYEACATFCESRRNFPRASEIYELGLARQAQPLSRLQNMYKGFLERMDRRHKRQLREEQERGGSLGEQGQPRTFGQKLSGRGQVRPIQQPGRHLSQRSPLHRVNNAPLHVFVDPEFGGSSSRQTASVSHAPWQNLAPDAERRKENVQRPMKWSDAKITTQSNPPPQPSLKIFVDEEFVRPKEQTKTFSPRVPASLKLRHDGIGGRSEVTLKSKPLQHFSEASPSVRGEQVTVGNYGFDLSMVTVNGSDMSFEEVRALKWQRHLSPQSKLSAANVQAVEPPSKGAAVLDWLNNSPVIKLAADSVIEGLPILWDERLLNAGKAQRESNVRVPIVEESMKAPGGENSYPGNGDETIAIRKIAQEAMITEDPEVGNIAVQHPGLVEPTINTKEAMNDIISMFQSDLPCERKRRPDDGRANKNVTAIGAWKFPGDTKQSFQVYMDEELGEQNAAKPIESLKGGTASDRGDLQKAHPTKSNAVQKKQGFQVYVDEGFEVQKTSELSQKTRIPSGIQVHAREEWPEKASTGVGITEFKVKGRRESFQAYVDEELGGPSSEKRDKEVLEVKPSSVSVAVRADLPRRLMFGEDTVELKANDGVQSFPVYRDEELEGQHKLQLDQNLEDATVGSKQIYSEEDLPNMMEVDSVAGRATGPEGYVFAELGGPDTLNLSTKMEVDRPGSAEVYPKEVFRSLGAPGETAGTMVNSNGSTAVGCGQDILTRSPLDVYQDENIHDPSVNIARSIASLELYSGKENRSPNLLSEGRTANEDGSKPSAKVKVLDPWDKAFLVKLLNGLDPPLSDCAEYYVRDTKYPGSPLSSLKRTCKEKTVELEGRAYFIKSCAGQGAFAQVYLADDDEGDDAVVLKIQKPCWPWEFYMYTQLDKRIPVGERASFGQALKMHCYSDYSIMVCKYGEHGTLQDVINAYLARGEKMHEVLCIFYTIEMLRMLENLHSVGLVHGDFKPDNLLIRTHNEGFQNWSPERPGCWQHEGLCLIDWGRSIDLSLFPPGTQFLADCKTDGFRCIEMLEERPWTYQIDTYGLCVVVHCLLHGSYLEVKKASAHSKYQPRAEYKRYMNAELWRKLFDPLLNIESCEKNPPLQPIRRSFEDYLLNNPAIVRDLTLLVRRQNIMMHDR